MPLDEWSMSLNWESIKSVNLSRLRFEGELERSYQMRYYVAASNTLRIVAPLLALLFVLYAVRTYFDRLPFAFIVGVTGPALVLCAFVFGLTWIRGIERCWQPIVVVASWIAMIATLHTLATQMASMAVNPPSGQFDAVASFGLQFLVLLACLATFRLGFAWSFLLYGGVLLIAMWALATQLGPVLPDSNRAVWMFLQPTPFVLLALLVMALVQERLARSAYLANRHLAELQAQEHRRRLRSEETLQVLGGAIGGIVHDLGNPLTVVQSGADTLRHFMDNGQVDEATTREFLDMITDGAQMLGYLRLSLIEQTRIVEGKPVPVDLQPASVRAIAEAGARFQKPRVTGNRQVVIEGPDVTLLADEKKMVTVLMNLIGNALKYSDGQVRVCWQPFNHHLLIGVLDQGQRGRGLTEEQAQKLFTAFGRLESHSQIEGTGLGLLSARKIVEAHNGEAFVEGFSDGTLSSPHFSTAQNTYPSLLGKEFRTAFVVSCPLAPES